MMHLLYRMMHLPYFRTEADAEAHARHLANTIIKVEMTKRKMTYRDLVAALAEYGVTEEERNLRNKISRGTFSAAFFFTCLGAMKVKNLDLTHWLTPMEDTVANIGAIVAGEKIEPETPAQHKQRHEDIEAMAELLGVKPSES